MPIEGLKAYQARANRLGFKCTPDGDWGPETEAAFAKVFVLAEGAKGIQPPAFPKLPPNYAWLASIPTLPLTIHEALKLLGTVEVPGRTNSPVIMGWAAEVGLATAYSEDSVPWCGLFAAVVARRARKEIPANPLWARNWLNFGKEVKQPGLGDVLVFGRDGGGHVAFYVGEDAGGFFHILGGNQSDSVSIMRIAKSRLLGARRPIYNTVPDSVKPYRVASSGVVSTNEA